MCCQRHDPRSRRTRPQSTAWNVTASGAAATAVPAARARSARSASSPTARGNASSNPPTASSTARG